MDDVCRAKFHILRNCCAHPERPSFSLDPPIQSIQASRCWCLPTWNRGVVVADGSSVDRCSRIVGASKALTLPPIHVETSWNPSPITSLRRTKTTTTIVRKWSLPLPPTLNNCGQQYLTLPPPPPHTTTTVPPSG